MYKIIGYRWANANGHSYPFAEYKRMDTAIKYAEKETENRGGHYSFVVFANNIAIHVTQISEHYKRGLGQNRKEIELGMKLYTCTDCGYYNIEKDNNEIEVGICHNCKHPL